MSIQSKVDIIDDALSLSLNRPKDYIFSVSAAILSDFYIYKFLFVVVVSLPLSSNSNIFALTHEAVVYEQQLSGGNDCVCRAFSFMRGSYKALFSI